MKGRNIATVCPGKTGEDAIAYYRLCVLREVKLTGKITAKFWKEK